MLKILKKGCANCILTPSYSNFSLSASETDSNGVVHSDGDLDHDSFSVIMKSLLAGERLKSSPELPPIPASWGEMQQSDWRSYAAKVIEVFKQPGQKYSFEDMPL